MARAAGRCAAPWRRQQAKRSHHRPGVEAKSDGGREIDRNSIDKERFFQSGLKPPGELNAKLKIKLADRGRADGETCFAHLADDIVIPQGAVQPFAALPRNRICGRLAVTFDNLVKILKRDKACCRQAPLCSGALKDLFGQLFKGAAL